MSPWWAVAVIETLVWMVGVPAVYVQSRRTRAAATVPFVAVLLGGSLLAGPR